MENRDKNRLAANVDAVVEQIGARLPAEQARAVTRRMLEAGRLIREGDTFRLVR